MSVDYNNINSVLSIFNEQAHQFKEKPYLWRKINDKYVSLSWSEVHDKVCRLALALSGLGILNGDRVIIVSENRPDEYVTRKITKAVAKIYYGKQKELVLGDTTAMIDWGYAKDYVEMAHKIVQQKKPDFFVIATGKKYSVRDFAKKCFNYVGLDYKKYLKIDKHLKRQSKNASLVGDTTKAQRILKYKVRTNIDELISIMMDNDLKIEN